MGYGYRKYKARPVIVDGIKFDSKKEYKRFLELSEMERLGQINDLQRQVRFELVPSIKEPDTVGKKGGIIKGKTIERPVYYIADYTYYENGDFVVEDVKGLKTPEYIIKRKLMLYLKGIKIRET